MVKSLFRLAFGALIVAAASSSSGVSARSIKASLIGAAHRSGLPIGVQPVAHPEKPVTKPKPHAEVLGASPKTEHVDHHGHHDMHVVTVD